MCEPHVMVGPCIVEIFESGPKWASFSLGPWASFRSALAAGKALTHQNVTMQSKWIILG